jgi:hypothetical protein
MYPRPLIFVISKIEFFFICSFGERTTSMVDPLDCRLSSNASQWIPQQPNAAIGLKRRSLSAARLTMMNENTMHRILNKPGRYYHNQKFLKWRQLEWTGEKVYSIKVHTKKLKHVF